jgi:predicted  nucleic acid-binding Zn-ribbon protein
MSERTAETTTTVDEDGIRVEKSFTDDAFPVPAVMYELSSTRENPVRVRIVDRIPESFPMDRIGFHPEYESDSWTAYKDHRVEFERVIDPGDAVETVFGIRDDDPDLDGFLGSPIIEHVPVGEEIEDVLGAGDTDAVREVLSGDRTTLPGMDEPLAPDTDAQHGEGTEGDLKEGGPSEPEDAEADDLGEEPPVADAEGAVERAPEADADSDEPSGLEGDEEPVEADEAAETDDPAPRTVTAGTAAVTAHAGASDSEADPEGDDEQATEAVADDAEPSAVDDADTEEAPGDTDTEEALIEAEPPRPAAPASGLAAALAAEIRTGEVDDDDLETLRSELDMGAPSSVDVRIGRLQSSVADIEAYADALAEFIDGEGTARQILDGLDEQLAAVESEMVALDERVASADTDREALHEEVSRVDESVSSVTDEVETVTGQVEAVDNRVDTVAADVSNVEDSVASVEASVEGVTGDVSRLDDESASLGAAVDDLGEDVETLYESVNDTAADLEATENRVDDVEDRMARFDEEFDDLWGDLAEVDTRLTDIEDRLGGDLEDVEAELDAINEHLEELEAFRNRLNEAFGP